MASAAASAYYGKINHPTLDDVARMMHDFWVEAKRKNPGLRQQQLRFWKMDLKGAFVLMSLRPGDVGLFAMLQTDDIFLFERAEISG